MKVTNQTKDTGKSLSTLEVGSLFIYNDEIFMKTDELSSNGHRRCVKLSTGMVIHFSGDHKIIPVNVKELIIK